VPPAAGDEAAVPLSPALAAVKQANELVRQGKAQEATALAASIDDPVAAKLIEWALLRRADGASLRRLGTDERNRPACSCARRDGRGQPRRRREQGSGGVAIGTVVGRNGNRDARRVPRHAAE
jgi:hypothetical protein